jgi:hypothetical protein
VRSIATRMGYPEAALWVDEHRHEYSEVCFVDSSQPSSRDSLPLKRQTIGVLARHRANIIMIERGETLFSRLSRAVRS